MKRKMILILEDNPERLRQFEAAMSQLGPLYRLRTWCDANRMIAECDEMLADAALISLDHDLNKEHEDSADPGDGVQAARFLAALPQICPVILHTSNTERVWSMHNEFRFGGWECERVAPLGEDWINRSWLSMASALLEKIARNEHKYYRPAKVPDRGKRLARALLSLHGLAIGDGIGEMMFGRANRAFDMIMKDGLPAGPWWHTDDTEMALSIVEVLRVLGCIHENTLARHFMLRFEREPGRGYGGGVRLQLSMMLGGISWQITSREAFDGQGSMGNGSAMRIAPLGAWFADDLDRVVKEAENSAIVTHRHPEGVAGAIATAVAAAMAWRFRGRNAHDIATQFLNEIHERTPASETRRGIAQAFEIRDVESPHAAAQMLGNGSRVICPDTVPFAVWVAAKYFGKYREAIAATASVGGDIDTNCAIVGGIVALSAGWEGIPKTWLQGMEALPYAHGRDVPTSNG